MEKTSEEKKEGKNNELSFSVVADSVTDAKSKFMIARQRLLHPDGWYALAGRVSASFQLMSRDGYKCEQPAHVHDYVRIDIPGPGPTAGQGYDWVVIDAINEKSDTGNGVESIEVVLRPATDPTSTSGKIAHFFKKSSTSTFIITRTGVNVTSVYLGRHELINNDDVGLKDKVRNTAVGSAAMAGVSELQWSALLKGFLSSQE